MLWLSAFHIVFGVALFVGRFYLPRLFVYHVGVADDASHERCVTMERRLLAITNIGALFALGFGVATLLAVPGYLQMGWMHAKLALVLLLVGYHGMTTMLAGRFRDRRNTRSVRWLKLYNEVPALLLVGIVLLVVLKPS